MLAAAVVEVEVEVSDLQRCGSDTADVGGFKFMVG